ncbi:MAG: DUF1540 domain-containing protein [Bacillota bacterium]
MTTEVKCEVHNCVYWEASKCTADNIEVSKDFIEGTDIEAGTMGKKPDHSSQTQCGTFKPENQ